MKECLENPHELGLHIAVVGGRWWWWWWWLADGWERRAALLQVVSYG